MAESSPAIYVPEKLKKELDDERRDGQSYYGIVSELLQHWREDKHEE
jgi:hypothetical protein